MTAAIHGRTIPARYPVRGQDSRSPEWSHVIFATEPSAQRQRIHTRADRQAGALAVLLIAAMAGVAVAFTAAVAMQLFRVFFG